MLQTLTVTKITNTYLFKTYLSFPQLKGVVLLRREISLKVIWEKVKFSVGDFRNNFLDCEWSYIIYFSKTYLMITNQGEREDNYGLT